MINSSLERRWSRVAFNPKLRLIFKNRSLYLMILPAVVFYLIFCYLPMYGVTIAFKDWNISKGIMGSPWAGLKYFEEALRDQNFWIPLRNTLIISIYKLLFAFPIPIVLSLLMNEMLHIRFKRFIQTILYLPRFISWVIVGGLIINLLNVNGGIVNEILKLMGQEPINFLLDKNYARGLVVISAIWKEAGWGTIIYLAALSSINVELYEAAIVDGAGRWKQLIHVTLPGIKHIVVIMLIFAVGSIIGGNFEQIYVIYHPLVFEKIDILDTYVFRTGILGGRVSYSTAIGLLRSVVSLLLILGADRLSKWMGEEGLL